MTAAEALAVIRDLVELARRRDTLAGARAEEAIAVIRDRARAELEAATLALVELRGGARPGAFIQHVGTLERLEAIANCQVDRIFRAAEYRIELRMGAEVLHRIGTVMDWDEPGSGLSTAQREAARWLDARPLVPDSGLSVVIVETISRRRYRLADTTTYTGTVENYEMLDFGAGRGLQDEKRVVWTSAAPEPEVAIP